MENNVEVKSLTFKIGDKEITLTPFEAKQLQSILNNLFEKEIIIQKEYIPVQPYVSPYQQPWYPNPMNPIIYGSGGTGGVPSDIVTITNGNVSNSLQFSTADKSVLCSVNL